jgi:single-strand DNA-binding protein
MNDTMMTIVGNVVDEPRRRRTGSGHEVTNFRIASTARRFDREKGAFVDTSTLYVNVTTWRQAAVNVQQSVHKGQPVVVSGRFTMREYTVDEQVRTAYELEAVAVGHDLTRGTSEFTRVYVNPSVTVVRDETGAPRDDSDHWLGLTDADAPAEDEPERELAAV